MTGDRCSIVRDGQASCATGELHGAMAERGGDGRSAHTTVKLHVTMDKGEVASATAEMHGATAEQGGGV